MKTWLSCTMLWADDQSFFPVGPRRQVDGILMVFCLVCLPVSSAKLLLFLQHRIVSMSCPFVED